MTIDDRLRELGIELPEPFPPAGNYVAGVRTGSLLYTSGMGPVRADGSIVTGKVGADLDLAGRRRGRPPDRAPAARRACGPSSARSTAVRRVVKTFGMVNVRARASTARRRSSTAARTCSSRCSATPAAVLARPSAWPSCRSTSPSRSSSCWKSLRTASFRGHATNGDRCSPPACSAWRPAAATMTTTGGGDVSAEEQPYVDAVAEQLRVRRRGRARADRPSRPSAWRRGGSTRSASSGSQEAGVEPSDLTDDSE